MLTPFMYLIFGITTLFFVDFIFQPQKQIGDISIFTKILLVISWPIFWAKLIYNLLRRKRLG